MKDPNKVKKGDTAETYNGNKGKVLMIVKAKDADSIDKFDESGWMYGSDFGDLLDIDNDYLIAVKTKEEGTQVYTYSGDGAMVEAKVNEGSHANPPIEPAKQYYLSVMDGQIGRTSQVLSEFNISVVFEGNTIYFANQNDAYKAAARIHLYGVQIIESNMDLSQA